MVTTEMGTIGTGLINGGYVVVVLGIPENLNIVKDISDYDVCFVIQSSSINTKTISIFWRE